MKSNVTIVSPGALMLALNVLRRAGRNEVADELEKTAQSITVELSQCLNTKAGADIIPVQYWDSIAYNPSSGVETDQSFLMEIDDQRKTGKVCIDVASENGDIDDLLCATFEINRLPGSQTDTQCLHLHFDGDNLAASFFKQGDSYIIRAEEGVSMHEFRLPKGERGWLLM